MIGSHPVSRLARETCDRIVDFLGDCPVDLRACALTARCFLPAAQSQIFSDISVDNHNTDDTLTEEEAQEEARGFAKAAFRRLASVLTHSPHLKQYIRSGTLTADLEVIVLVAGLGLPRLEELCLYGDGECDLDGLLINPLQRLVALPSLRRLSLFTDYSVQIFRHCSPNLTELVFDMATQEMPWHTWDVTMLCRPTIAHLTIKKCVGTADWLIDAKCPFDLTQLRSVTVLKSMTSNARHVLSSAEQTINEMTLGPEDIGCLNLARFPALNHIYLHLEHICQLRKVLPAFSGLDNTNSIQTITIRVDSFSLDDVNPLIDAEVAQFYEALSWAHLPAIQKLAFDPPEENRDEFFTMLDRALPILQMRHAAHVSTN
ncbi:hypothetical protein DFH07DRAFT_969693 [Mycena maculata]|uniref:F-box domain-containing protein n=1 Tax=Mycena maculata TaxID=230809 RepID=A0AAD7HV98_9AGAR|nr:hypothetical protein DFH07DRAFT_969693 [Mycena maculata]